MPTTTESSLIYSCLRPALDVGIDMFNNLVPGELAFRPSADLSHYERLVELGVPPVARIIDDNLSIASIGELINALWLHRFFHLQADEYFGRHVQQHVDALRDLSRLAQLAMRQHESLQRYQEAGL
jgi:hypothetical protein